MQVDQSGVEGSQEQPQCRPLVERETSGQSAWIYIQYIAWLGGQELLGQASGQGRLHPLTLKFAEGGAQVGPTVEEMQHAASFVGNWAIRNVGARRLVLQHQAQLALCLHVL
jgi:hypothetical protein